LFWAAVAYSYWPELLPALLRLASAMRGVGAREVDSAFFDVRDNSTADEAQVRAAVDELEAQYADIHRFLGQEPATAARIPVLIANGSGPALTDGTGLTLAFDGRSFDLSTAPLFLALLREGNLSLPGMSPFVEGGYAVYVAEEIGRAEDLLGQPADAWVTLFAQHGSLLPLAQAWAAQLPEGEADLAVFLRAVVQGGSFVRWVAETQGLEAVEALRSGLGLEDVVGLPIAEAERAWLDSVLAKGLAPLPCARAVPRDAFLHNYCKQLE
jgi:hypothetical protein